MCNDIFFVSLNLRYQPYTFSRSIYCYNCPAQQAQKRMKSADTALEPPFQLANY
jgi:hypothetical protein